MSSVSRREFLRNGAIAGASLAYLASRPAWAALPSIPIGIQLYTVGKELQADVPGTLHQIAAIGYTEVETAGFAGLTAAKFREGLQHAGLRCHSAHMQWNLANPGPVFDDANALGVRYVVSSALFPHGSGEPTVDAYKEFAARLNDLGAKARKAGLHYAYHNHNFEFRDLGGVIGYDILLNETDPALVDFELDCGWAIAAGYQPIDYFKKHAGRFRMVHIKDFVAGSKLSTSLAPGLRPQGTELGRGSIDYKPILQAAALEGVEFYYVEQEPPFLDMPALQASTVDYQYLRQL